jgi:mevalonate kinase
MDGAWTLQDDRRETPGYKKSKLQQQEESVKRILEFMKINVKETPVQITLGGDLIAASGLGASAASCVAIARAASDEFGLGLGDQRINEIAFEGEKPYHGTPSGVDNTASTFGGIMTFQKDVVSKENRTETITLDNSLEFVVADSGVVVNTASVGVYVRERMEREKKRFETAFTIIHGQVRELKEGLKRYDLAQVGKMMNEYHRQIISLGLSHEKLVDLCNLANQEGALGAKLTGGGMGGNMIALTPGARLQEKVAQALESRGCRPLRVKIGGRA